MTNKTITIDGIEYVRADSIPAPAPSGGREVVVCDRGFIYVGDVTEECEDYLSLRRVQNVRRWERNGFGGLLRDPKAAVATLDDAVDMRVRLSSVLSRHPVPEGWGV